MPRLHVLKLHESPLVGDDNYDRFHHRWILVTTTTSGAPNQSFELEQTQRSFPEIQTGDIVWVPDLSTGAGEFEGVFFVGTPIAEGEFPLLKCSVEGPDFPPSIAVASASELRDRYEVLFDHILQSQHLSLADLFGGAQVVEDFWQHPTIQRRRDLPSSEPQWRIPLESCTLLRTYEAVTTF